MVSTNSFLTGKGQLIQVGSELGRGGEGSVHAVLGDHKRVAKLYNYHHMPDGAKQSKLRVMAAAADDQLLTYAAWPVETLHKTHNGPVVGFLMPLVAGRAPVHTLYSPAHRRQDYPEVAWDFLLFVARNMAAAFAAIHSHGHVLGDVNQGNVMVGKDSKVVLIDCDSFQINSNGESHLCKVGVSHFTPPELQGLSSFDGVKRTSNHDNFGLALLIFHILFGGRHPYSGVPLRKGVADVLETDIKAFRYAYARDAQSRGIAPPPKCISLSLVPASIGAMFELAFTERGAQAARPTAQEWVSTLDALRTHLKRCAKIGMHIYPDHQDLCPWCALESHGIVYFIDLSLGFTTTANNFSLIQVWATINSMPAPSPVPMPNIASISVTPTPLPPGIDRAGQTIVVRVLVVCVAIGLFAAAPAAWLFIVIGAWIAWKLSGSFGESKRNAERTTRCAALDAARRDFNVLDSRAKQEIGSDRFAEKKQELTRLRDEYHALPAKEQSEMDGLRATAEARQKHQFLDRCFIDVATISGVGSARKAALQSFGIETAADVDWHKVLAVHGFGEVLTRAVVDWKKSCERRFVFDLSNAVSEADKNAIRARIAARRRAIESALASGATELKRIQAEGIAKANTLTPILESAARKVAQAQADLSLL